MRGFIEFHSDSEFLRKLNDRNKRKVFISWKNIFRRKKYKSECLIMPMKNIKDVKMSTKISNRTTDRFIRRHAFKLVYVKYSMLYAASNMQHFRSSHKRLKIECNWIFWNLYKSPKRLKKMYEKKDVSSETEIESCPGT